MKKFIAVFLILARLCTFCSCNTNSDDSTETSDPAKSAETSTPVESTEKPQGNVTPPPATDGDVPALYLYSLEELNAYASANYLPSNFVDYESIASMGSFKYLLFPVKGYHTYYIYRLIDANGFSMDVYVTHIEDKSITDIDSYVMANHADKDILHLSDSTNIDLTWNLDYASKQVNYNDILYSYRSDGTLRNISTVIDEKKIVISPTSRLLRHESETGTDYYLQKGDFRDYKPSENTLLTALLDGSPTADTMMEEIFVSK